MSNELRFTALRTLGMLTLSKTSKDASQNNLHPGGLSIIAKYRHERSPAARSAPEGCAGCIFRETCQPDRQASSPGAGLDSLIATHRSVRRGETLFRRGELFTAIFAVKSGFFKTRTSLEGGREHVTRFQMPGDLLGFDGIGTDEYGCDAVALEDSHACVIYYAQFEHLANVYPQLQRQLHRAMSQEILREQEMMLMLSSMRAEERVAGFLLNFSERLGTRGLSTIALELPMSRQDIGSYLGLSLETVSRCLSKLNADGVVDVCQRSLRILDGPMLSKLVPATQRQWRHTVPDL